jgi:hypothetical protein
MKIGDIASRSSRSHKSMMSDSESFHLVNKSDRSGCQDSSCWNLRNKRGKNMGTTARSTYAHREGVVYPHSRMWALISSEDFSDNPLTKFTHTSGLNVGRSLLKQVKSLLALPITQLLKLTVYFQVNVSKWFFINLWMKKGTYRPMAKRIVLR